MRVAFYAVLILGALAISADPPNASGELAAIKEVANSANHNPLADHPLSAELQPYLSLAARCEKYEKLAGRWEPVFRLDLGVAGATRPVQPAGIELGNPSVKALEVLRITREDGRDVLTFDASKFLPGLLRLGKPVEGDFRIEFLARVVSDKVCDLSITCGDPQTGPGFQFGGFDNARNVLWIGRNEHDGNALTGELMIELPHDRLIARGEWHRVGMQVAGGLIAAYIDGHRIGQAPLGTAVKREAPRQPTLYTSGTKIQLADARVEQYQISMQDPRVKARWVEVFGTETPERVTGQIRTLCGFLDHQDAATRDGAQALLHHMGRLAEPAVIETAQDESASLEQRARARALSHEFQEPARAPVDRTVIPGAPPTLEDGTSPEEAPAG